MRHGSIRIRTARNLMFLCLMTISVGWLGILLNRALGDSPAQGPGMLLWLVAPLTVSIFLRALAGDGWVDLGLRPRFKLNIRWYALGLFAYPVCIALVLALGSFLGVVDYPGFAANGLRPFLELGAVSLITTLFKNVFEECVWRGYLTPKLQLLGTHDLVNHLFVGVIWSAWHLPYWLGLLDPATLAKFTALSLPAFILSSVMALIASSLLHGELRLATDSAWPPLLLHTVGNALTLTLLADGFVAIKGSGQALFTPGFGGLLVAAMILVVGIWVYLHRTQASP